MASIQRYCYCSFDITNYCVNKIEYSRLEAKCFNAERFIDDIVALCREYCCRFKGAFAYKVVPWFTFINTYRTFTKQTCFILSTYHLV